MTEAPAFRPEDFDVFAIDAFEPRMEAIKEQIRPKLRRLGDILAPRLGEETGLPFYAHVATHARRKVNPPDDTWVAFGRNQRGYKRFAHLAVGVELDGLYTHFVVKPEADDKEAVGRLLAREGLRFLNTVRSTEGLLLYGDTPGKEPLPVRELSADQVAGLAGRLQELKTAGLTLGYALPRERVAELGPVQLLQLLHARLMALVPLYRETVQGVGLV